MTSLCCLRELCVRRVLGLFRACFGCLSGLFVLAAEALDSAGGVYELLFAGEERVAVRADFQVDIALMGGSGGKAVPARAHHAYLVVCGMDIGFHLFSSLYHRGTRSLSASFPGTLSLREFAAIRQTSDLVSPLGPQKSTANQKGDLFRSPLVVRYFRIRAVGRSLPANPWVPSRR